MAKGKKKTKSGFLGIGKGGFLTAFRGIAASLTTIGVASTRLQEGDPLPATTDTMTGLKNFVNLWTGRIANLNVFPDAKQYQQRINPLGWLNADFIGGTIMTFTGGLLRSLGGRIGLKGKGLSTASSWLTSIGGAVAAGGAIGGIFGAENGGTHHNPGAFFASSSPSIGTHRSTARIGVLRR